MAGLYGSGAVIIRELKVRWHKDFRSVLLLGAAYGILEEGLMVKSFFDPNWVDLGALGSFGRYAETSFVWAEMLIIYHAVFSITIPIALAELAYPHKKDEPWIGKRLFVALLAVLVTVTVIGFLYLTPYRPPAAQYMLAALAMVLFGYAAYRLPARSQTENTGRTGRPRTLFAVGALGSTAFFMLFWEGPYTTDSPPVIMAMGIALAYLMKRFYFRYDWRNPSMTMTRLAAVAGALSFMIFLAFILELQMPGMSIVALATIAELLLLRRKIRMEAR